MPVDAEANVESKSNPSNRRSFKQKLQTAKEENAESKIGLCFVVCGLCLGTIACQLISLLFAVIPIAMIYFGATNLDNCTISSFIPIFLLVQGICTLLDQLLIYCQCRDKDAEDIDNKSLIGRLFDLFVFVWFIVGSVYIYKVYEPNYIEANGPYCDKTTYLFAFWCVTVVYGFIAFMIFACCCILLIGCFIA